MQVLKENTKFNSSCKTKYFCLKLYVAYVSQLYFNPMQMLYVYVKRKTYNFNPKYISLKVVFANLKQSLFLLQNFIVSDPQVNERSRFVCEEKLAILSPSTESGIQGRNILTYLLVMEKTKNKYYSKVLIIELHTSKRIV